MGRRISRREALRRGSFAAAFGFLPGALSGCDDDAAPEQEAGGNQPAPPGALALDFTAVPKGLDDLLASLGALGVNPEG